MNLYETIRSDILLGEFEPGSKLRMDGLKTRYHSGINVLRECLVRLTSEGLVESEDQKGFRIASASQQRLSELTKLRILLECDGLRNSMQRACVEWESNLVAAHHKLVYMESKMHDDPQKYFPRWHQCDYEFHAALIADCGSDLHCHYHRLVYDQFRQYVLKELKTQGFRGIGIVDEHKLIMDKALSGDQQACCAALTQHLQGFEQRLVAEQSLDFD